jgi:hypothetical protein
MAVTEIVSPTNVIINLDDPPTGHRLAELVQALTGCSIERAELAICDPAPAGPATSTIALDTMARALVALKSRSEAEIADPEVEAPPSPTG